MPKTVIDQMVDRFLSWRLPEDFRPDCGISFTKFHPNGTTQYKPIGTNLLTAEQARAMIENIITGVLPPDNYATWDEGKAYTHGYFDGYNDAKEGKS